MIAAAAAPDESSCGVEELSMSAPFKLVVDVVDVVDGLDVVDVVDGLVVDVVVGGAVVVVDGAT